VTSATQSALDRARDVLRAATLPDKLRLLGKGDVGSYAVDSARLLYYDGRRTTFLSKDVTPDILAASLAYIIKVRTKTLKDEASAKLGISKYKGLPHLPAGFKWPKGQYFAAQFNLETLSPLDTYGVFPTHGMLYVFMSSEGDRATVAHYDGPLKSLQVTPYPDPASLPDAKYYLKDFMKESARIEFTPNGILYLGGDAYTYEEAYKLIPDALRLDVEKALGCPLTYKDTDTRIFGRPLYWQGEDEAFVHRRTVKEIPIVLYQDEFGEGHIHVWVNPSDAVRGDFSKCWLDYSGT